MTRYRLALPLIVAGFYGGLFALRNLGLSDLYENLLYGLGITPFDFPFVDAQAILSAAQCHRAGIAIYPTNPCDVLLRPLPYSPVWLDLVPAFMTTADTPALGIAFDLAFLAALPLVLRPRSRGELILITLAGISTSVTFGVERGNVDLLLFGLAALASVLYGRGPTGRLAAYTLGFAGGLLKFYPFVLLVMALREAPRRLLMIVLGALLGLAAFAGFYHAGIRDALSAVPSGTYFGDAFSAQNLPFGIVHLGDLGDTAGWAILAGLIAVSVFIVAGLTQRLLSDPILVDWTQPEAGALLAGSLVVLGCFLAGQSVGYRAIYLLLVLPGLLRFRQSAGEQWLRTTLSLAIATALALLWGEAIRHSIEWGLGKPVFDGTTTDIAGAAIWVLREILWWWMTSVLATMLALFALQCPLGRGAAKVFHPVAQLWSRP